MIGTLVIGYLIGMGAAWLSMWAYGQVRKGQPDRVLNLLALLVWVLVCLGLGLVLAAWWLPPA